MASSILISVAILLASMLIAPGLFPFLQSSEPFSSHETFNGGYYLPINQGLTSFLYVKSWKPEGKPAAVVVFVHGLGEHIGRYEHVFSEFAAKGIMTVGFDTRGFGRSTGTRGGAPTIDELFDDIELIRRHAAIHGVKTFLFGHSLGGLQVLSFVAKRGDKVKFDGVIASAPALGQVFKVNPVVETLGKILASLPVLKNICVPSDIPHKGISRDPAVVSAYEDDLLVHGKIALVFANSVFTYQDWMAAEGCKKITIPTLIVHGDKDTLTNFNSSKICSENIPSSDKTFVALEDFFHEAHNDPGKEKVIEAYIDWILKRASTN